MIKYCNNCGQEFNVNLSYDFFAARKFCSDRCRSSFYKRYTRELNKMLVTEKQCPVCGNWFKPKPAPHNTQQIYCSAKCRTIHNNAKHNPKPRTVKHCIVCGKPLDGHKTKYCSYQCSAAAEVKRKESARPTRTCDICGEPLTSSGSGITCDVCRNNRDLYHAPKPLPKKKPAKSFDDYAREADECGLSYGKYKVALKLGKTYEQLKAEYQRQL